MMSLFGNHQCIRQALEENGSLGNWMIGIGGIQCNHPSHFLILLPWFSPDTHHDRACYKRNHGSLLFRNTCTDKNKRTNTTPLYNIFSHTFMTFKRILPSSG